MRGIRAPAGARLLPRLFGSCWRNFEIWGAGGRGRAACESRAHDLVLARCLFSAIDDQVLDDQVQMGCARRESNPGHKHGRLV